MRQFILITGCSSGIGLCLAQGLQQHGYAVVATCRQPADVERLRALGLEALVLDLADSGSIRSAVEAFFALSDGGIFALINNGAYGQPGAVEDLSRAALREAFETNVFGTQELTNLIIPVMRRQQHGRIVQISSILGLVCLVFRGAYNASKYALEALTDTMRLELDGSGIHLSLIEPGPITSRFNANALAAFHRHIDQSGSHFSGAYAQLEQRLNSKQANRFTLPADAVLQATLSALRANNPKTRYLVTTPARIMAPAKRLLPDKWMDRLLQRVGR